MPKTDATISQRWADFLAGEGYRPDVQTHSTDAARHRILFKSERLHFTLYLDDRDPTFTNLELTYRLDDATDEPEVLLAAANAISARTKGTKVTVDQEERTANFTNEWFADAPPSGEVFERIVSQCVHAADGFFARIREMAKPVEIPKA